MLTTLKKFAIVALPVALLALGASGCGGDEPSRNYAPTKDSGAASGPKVTTRSSAQGTILADSSGRAFYVFSKDNGNETSQCIDACPGAWPPATISGAPKATGEAEQSKIGTIKNGPATQLTYDGKPLYYYIKDRKPKQVKGNGVESFGGTWYNVKPNGDATD